MSTTTLYVHGQTEQLAIHLVVETEERRYERTVTKSKIDTIEKLAAWLLIQPQSGREDEADFRQQLVVDWHLDEQGVTVIDSVVTSEPLEEIAWANLLTSPLATVTVEEANRLVDDANGIEQIKAYLKDVNALLINMRDINNRMMETAPGAEVR